MAAMRMLAISLLVLTALAPAADGAAAVQAPAPASAPRMPRTLPRCAPD